MPKTEYKTNEFERARPTLVGLAYRILGSYAEAEDVVQDTYLSWMAEDHEQIGNPKGWLTTVCTRRAIDAARSARLARTNYIGVWLPEPVQTEFQQDAGVTPDENLILAQSLTTAFLLTLQRLSAKERAAFILHDVFDTSYEDIASVLETSEPACRKLVSRARTHVRQKRTAPVAPVSEQTTLIETFLKAVQTGETAELATLFAKDVIFQADGGGKAAAIDGALIGARAICEFIEKVIAPAWSREEVLVCEINSGLGFFVREDGKTTSIVTFSYDTEGRVTEIYAMRNPDKLGPSQPVH